MCSWITGDELANVVAKWQQVHTRAREARGANRYPFPEMNYSSAGGCCRFTLLYYNLCLVCKNIQQGHHLEEHTDDGRNITVDRDNESELQT